MTADLENATKAAQTAALLVSDIRALLSSHNPLIADIALDAIGTAAPMVIRLERLKLGIEQVDKDIPKQVDKLLDAAIMAESFMAGFEDDDAQEGMAEKLQQLRNAIDDTVSQS